MQLLRLREKQAPPLFGCGHYGTSFMNRKTREVRILKRAREIAKTGRHIGWYYVEAELRTRMGEPLAREVLANQQVREELDQICTAARKLRRARQRDKFGA